jgi:hypothetical protein
MDSTSAERQPTPAHPARGSSRTGSSARPRARGYGRLSMRSALGRAGAPGAAFHPQKNPAKAAKADARTRTGDPFITRERQVGDARALAGTRGHLSPGERAVSTV